jgi:hypothetical protein
VHEKGGKPPRAKEDSRSSEKLDISLRKKNGMHSRRETRTCEDGLTRLWRALWVLGGGRIKKGWVRMERRARTRKGASTGRRGGGTQGSGEELETSWR